MNWPSLLLPGMARIGMEKREYGIRKYCSLLGLLVLVNGQLHPPKTHCR